jgi:hypothetical protein
VKSLRVDVVIAVCALLISTLACMASIFQTRVIADQLSATVWPYVDVTTNIVMSPRDTGWSVTIANDGLGPAVLRSVLLTVDGKPMKSSSLPSGRWPASRLTASRALRAQPRFRAP